ncbi:MAG: DegQ family serine endoprotease [Candidatus Coatesbacteria bacterium]|nr:MAG: DegQ family serine endoprotease [Candidatus Coatesbacteria bacterium]
MSFDAKTKGTLLAVAVGCFAAGAIVTGVLDLTPWSSAESNPSADLEALRRIGQGFSQVVKEVSPAVVNVRVTAKVSGRRPSFHGAPPFDFFGGDPFHGFFEQQPEEDRLERGSGSGVIVSADGYILTNNHVVTEADEITVVAADGERYEATVVGTDYRTDLAVIKIEGKNFPAAKLGDSSQLEVGEWVLAVGNPFELQNTVTAGIVSARGRSNVGLAEYEDFIQTDAAINPGNSGGPLVNLDGEVVGINTAIATRTGGNMGIGFAIPINMAKQVMDELIKTGKVTRGWLGVYIQPVTADFQKQFRLKSTAGALVADVNAGGPADKAGLKRGDVIVRYQGEKIEDTNHLRNLVADTEVGTNAEVGVIRNGKEKKIRVKIGELPEEEAAAGRQLGGGFEEDVGFEVKNLTPSLRRQLGLAENQEGVVVVNLKQVSDAYQQGLRQGDVIIELNRQEIADVSDFNAALGDLGPGDTVLLVVITAGHTRYISFELE